jgi:deoxyribose-phosphate aldolase
MASDLAQLIDHTLLKPEATAADVERVCAEAVRYGFKAVCLNPYWVSRAAGVLAETGVTLCSVADFPFGASRVDVKAGEAARAVADGAGEIDMVVNLGALRSGDLAALDADVRAVRAATQGVLKVIVEASALTEDELVTATEIAAGAGADFVKTSTGYHPSGGARLADLRLIKETIEKTGRADTVSIKASGGIRDLAFARELLDAGATRLGLSSGVALVEQERQHA